MIRYFALFSTVLVACAQTSTGPLLPSDAGLPADVATLAVPELQAPDISAAQDLAGVAFVPNTSSTSHVAIALPADTPPLTQALLIRQISRSLPDLSVDGVTLNVKETPGLVVWTLNGPQAGRTNALPALITAIANPQLTDDGLAGALSTRPHSTDPADPVTLRTLHTQTAVKSRLWISTDSATQELEPSVQALQDGTAVDDGDAWLDVRAQRYAHLAMCQIGTIGGSTPDTVRRMAKGLVVRRVATGSTVFPITAEVWRAGQADFFPAIQLRIDQVELPESHTMSACTFP